MEALLTELRSTQVLFDRNWVSQPLLLGDIELEQARDSYFNEYLHANDNRQGRYSFIYIVSGQGLLSLGKEQVAVQEGEYVFATNHSRWRLVNRSDRVPMRAFVLQMHRTMTNYVENGLWGLMASVLEHPLHGKDKGAAYDLLCDLMKELANRDRFSTAMLESLLRQLMIGVCRKAEPESESWSPLEAHQLVPPLTSRQAIIYRVIRCIDDNLVKMREFQKLADMVGYSYSHLSHLFREEMGESLQSYWRRRRTQQAKKLLEAGQLNITRIALLLNYQSVHAFSKAFKKAVGLTPSEYQDRHSKLAGRVM